MTLLFESVHPLVRHKVSLLRDVDTEPKKFRELVRELSMLLCYEATRDLDLVETNVTTPMGAAGGFKLRTKVGLIPILRAGLGMVEGVLEMLEIHIELAAAAPKLMRDLRLEKQPGFEVKPEPMMSLRLGGGLPMTVHPWTSGKRTAA